MTPRFSSIELEIRDLMARSPYLDYNLAQWDVNWRYETGYKDGFAGAPPRHPRSLSYTLGHRDGQADRDLRHTA